MEIFYTYLWERWQFFIFLMKSLFSCEIFRSSLCEVILALIIPSVQIRSAAVSAQIVATQPVCYFSIAFLVMPVQLPPVDSSSTSLKNHVLKLYKTLKEPC